jgi:hypothetical protein
MKRHISKFAILIIIIGAIVWLGAVNIRSIIASELFGVDMLSWNDSVSPEQLNTYFYIIAASSILTLIGYICVLKFTIIYTYFTDLKLKQNGWLMASLILFFIFVPVEVYTGIYDFKFVYNYFFASADIFYLKAILIKRVTALSGLPLIAMFCYYTIIGLCIWKPFKKGDT